MGEYIRINGQEVKLGTCEDLYYTTLDQLRKVVISERISGNMELAAYLDPKNGFRYRFPFPEEDGTQIGQYKDYNKGVTIQLQPDDWKLATFDHNHLWHSAHDSGHGYNVNIKVPCPQSPEFENSEHSPITWRIVEIRQQKQVAGEVWTVIACPYCGALVRIDYTEACMLAHSIDEGYIKPSHDAYQKERYTEIYKRIMRGYKTPVNAA